MAVLAIDIGGTKLAAGVVIDGEIRERAVAATPADDGELMWSTLLELVAQCGATRTTIDVVGVGCGGPMTRGGRTVSPLNIGGWRGFALRDRLSEALGVKCFVDNDAKALVLGEHRWGAGRGVDDLIALVVSTGVGGGIILDGRLLDGADGNAGHLGHMIVEPQGRACACGARGCLEAEASGTAIHAITGRPAAEASGEVIERTGRLVGRAVASVANLLDLRLALCAGSVALGFGEPFFAAAQAELDRCARLEFSAGAVIRPGGLGEAGPLLGAAAVGLCGLEAAK